MKFDEVRIINFFFYGSCFWCQVSDSLSSPVSQTFSIFYKTFIPLCLPFKYIFYFEFVFKKHVSLRLRFIFCQMSNFFWHLLQMSFLHPIAFALLSKKICLFWGSLFSSIDLCFSTITTQLYNKILKLKILVLLTLFFILKFVFSNNHVNIYENYCWDFDWCYVKPLCQL